MERKWMKYFFDKLWFNDNDIILYYIVNIFYIIIYV